MTTTDRLRAAPFVTLVLSFAAVLGLGMFIGPAVDQPVPSTPTTVPEQPIPPPIGGPTSRPLEPPATLPQPVPTRAKPPASQVKPTASPVKPPAIPVVGPDGNGRVVVGPLERGRPFASSDFHPTLLAPSGGRFELCVTTSSGERIADARWRLTVAAFGQTTYCTPFVFGDTVEFTVVPA